MPRNYTPEQLEQMDYWQRWQFEKYGNILPESVERGATTPDYYEKQAALLPQELISQQAEQC